MTPALFVLDVLRLLGPCPAPTRCPYCPADTPPHWIGWGTYQRYAGDGDRPSRKVAVRRYRCKISLRTFSLLPHALLPYRSVCTGLILEWLHALYVTEVPLRRLARRVGVARGTLRSLRAGFVRALPLLRLPRQDGRQAAAALLGGLAALPPSVLVPLFQDWKELEPKQCVVGIHSRSRCRPGATVAPLPP